MSGWLRVAARASANLSRLKMWGLRLCVEGPHKNADMAELPRGCYW